MIKHETTVEEAKQIKELGFDFSKACEKFWMPENNIHGLATNFPKGYYYKYIDNNGEMRQDSVSRIGSCPAFVDLESKEQYPSIYDKCHSQAKKILIPIIPYPILEACLPDDTLKQFTFVRWTRDITECGYEISCDKDMGYGWEEVLHKNFDQNIVEAFLWCAKNYPTETKEQFNKVMEMYE